MEADYDNPLYKFLAAHSSEEVAKASASPQTLRAALKPYRGGHSPTVEQDSQEANELATLEADRMDAAEETFNAMTDEEQEALSASVRNLFPQIGDDLMQLLGA